MAPKPQLPLLGRAYVSAIVASGAVVVAYSVYGLSAHHPSNSWLIFAAFTLVSGTLVIKVPTIPATISVSEMFVFAAVLLYGTHPATVIVALDGLLLSITSRTRRLNRLLFNIAEPALSIWIASSLFFAFSKVGPLSARTQPPEITSVLFPLALLTVAYFLLNSWLMALAIGIEQRRSPVRLWADHFIWLSLNYFGGASVAVLLVRNSQDPVGFAVVVPLLLISYLTNKYSMGRLEDANKHIAQLNATIRALAMAIDAKDQITHGHICRVQIYAIRLAQALGVTEEPLTKAIEAAALLHDTGKLAVPEYILNKPGRLTRTEFEKIKLHSTVGANILSQIEFPYPVIPIVRHHHENWDGSGYPAGLSGTDIPIGARILSVVDCFDALTSDRPYRPRLSDDDAIRILLERRGTWYDPLVVDAFLRVYAELGEVGNEELTQSSGVREIAESLRANSPSTEGQGLDDIAASSGEMLAVYELARSLAGRSSLGDAAGLVAKHLRRALPGALCVFYVLDPFSDELVAHADGTDASELNGSRIPRGHGIAGWVAANGKTIVNSDPALDLGMRAKTSGSPLRSCLSSPVAVDGVIVGVLTMYSSEYNAYGESHVQIIEGTARRISCVVFGTERSLAQSERESLGALTPTPSVPLVQSPSCGRLALLLFDVSSLRDGDAGEHAINGTVLRHVSAVVRAALRNADILLRHAASQFVVLLPETDRESAEVVAARVESALLVSPFKLPDGLSLSISVATAIAIQPVDGVSLSDLITVASAKLPLKDHSPAVAEHRMASTKESAA